MAGPVSRGNRAVAGAAACGGPPQRPSCRRKAHRDGKRRQKSGERMGKMTVGMVGVGLMGHGIARNLASKGWALGFLDHPGNQPVDDLLALGARRVADLAGLAADSEVVILCVSGSPQVEAILLGDDGLLARIRPGTVIVDCSTAIPSSTARLARLTQEAGGLFMDAAMTRTPVEAEQGRLNLLVGAEPELLDRMRLLLQSFSETIFHAGEVGAGHTLKLLHNYVSIGCATLLSEAAACARKSGIADAVFVEALTKGGGYGAALDRIAPFLLEGDASGMRFSVANAAKDLGYYLRLSHDAAAAHQAASGIEAALRTLAEGGFADSYLSEAAASFGAGGR
ncbi:NAD(P)-dependent oxidoreductase, partial [Cereibacter changlensis]